MFHVASKSRPGVKHVVREGDGRLTCDCRAFHYYGLCSHVVAVQSFLDMTRGVEVGAPAITAKGMAYLTRWRAEQAKQADKQPRNVPQDTACGASTGLGSSYVKQGAGNGGDPGDCADRDTALLRRSQQPFSLWK